jgi:hypothetical protein
VKISHPDNLTIQQYLDGTLDPKLMNALEQQALEDPFLAEALEGYAQNVHKGNDLSILQRQLHERIMLLQENKKVYDFTWQRLSVAAAAAVLFISAGVLFWMNTQKPEPQMASNHKAVEANLMPLDTMNRLRNLPDKQKKVANELYKSAPEVVLKTAQESKVAGIKKQYTVQLPREKMIVSKSSPRSDSELIDLNSATLSANVPMSENNSAEISSQLQGRTSGVAISKQKAVNLDEVVIVGYGSQRKKDITGSVSTINAVPLTLENRITGKIVSKNNGEPLPGVAIKDKNSNRGTTTDANGNFSLNVDSVSNLMITYIGYNTAEVKAKAGQDVSVALSESTSSLSEVVVTGYGRRDGDESKDITINYAQPENGWKAYNKYLAGGIKSVEGLSILTGRVKISFDVAQDNSLNNFVITKGLNDAYNQAAIQLIKDGPKWNANGKANAKGFVTVVFRKQ